MVRLVTIFVQIQFGRIDACVKNQVAFGKTINIQIVCSRQWTMLLIINMAIKIKCSMMYKIKIIFTKRYFCKSEPILLFKFQEEEELETTQEPTTTVFNLAELSDEIRTQKHDGHKYLHAKDFFKSFKQWLSSVGLGRFWVNE